MSTPIICANNNRNLKVIKAISRKNLKSPIIINSIKKMEAASATQITDPCQPVQILLARKIVGGLTAINTNNQDSPLNHTIVTSTRPEGVIQRRCSDESIIVKQLPNTEFENRNSAAVTTEEIIKKFRIPKGIALTPKFTNDLVVGTHISTDVVTHVSTALMSPTLTTNEDADNSSGLVEYVEEDFDDEEECEGVPVDEIEKISDSSDFQEYQETDQQEDDEVEDSDLIEEVESSEHQDLLMSGESDDIIEATNSNCSNVLFTSTPQPQTAITSTSSSVQQIIQAVQPNGSVTCFQLPPNTIVLQSPDGALLATTAPHPTKPGQQQIIAIQDLNSQLADVLNLSSTNTSLSSSPFQPSGAIVLSPGSAAVPLITTSGESSVSTEVAQQPTHAAAISSNESLIKAQQQQILA